MVNSQQADQKLICNVLKSNKPNSKKKSLKFISDPLLYFRNLTDICLLNKVKRDDIDDKTIKKIERWLGWVLNSQPLRLNTQDSFSRK